MAAMVVAVVLLVVAVVGVVLAPKEATQVARKGILQFQPLGSFLILLLPLSASLYLLSFLL